MPSSSDSGSCESDVSWFYSEASGDLGRSNQKYDFWDPKTDAVDTWDALARLVSPRRRKAVQRYVRMAPVMAEFQRRHPREAAVLEAVYTPRAYPADMTAVRLALSMAGARHMVTVIALVPASNRLRASQVSKGRTNETPQRYLAFEVANQNGRLVTGVRDELSGMLDRALAVYGEVGAVYAPPITSRRQARESWVEYINGGAMEAAE